MAFFLFAPPYMRVHGLWENFDLTQLVMGLTSLSISFALIFYFRLVKVLVESSEWNTLLLCFFQESRTCQWNTMGFRRFSTSKPFCETLPISWNSEVKKSTFVIFTLKSVIFHSLAAVLITQLKCFQFSAIVNIAVG